MPPCSSSKIGTINRSKDAAAVLGRAIIGPMHRIMITFNISAGILPIRFVTQLIPSSFLAITIIVKQHTRLSDNMYPIVAMSHSGEDCIPSKGGNITFPAPKNIANKASPITSISLTFFVLIVQLKKL